jgi:hypothetical protein
MSDYFAFVSFVRMTVNDFGLAEGGVSERLTVG